MNTLKLRNLTLIGLVLVIFYFIFGLNFNEYVMILRSKKMIAVVIVSILMSYSSITFQTITHNQLLTPSIMGLDWLYILMMTLFVSFSFNQPILEFILSLVAMGLFSQILFRVFFKKDRPNVYFLILSGMILGTLMNSLSTFIQVLMDPNEFDQIQTRIMPSFSKINEPILWISIGLTILILYFVSRNIDDLDVLQLGRDKAINLGVDYQQIISKHYLLISLSVGIVSGLVGPLTFLSILVASLARRLTQGFSHNVMFVIGFWVSLIFLVVGLWFIEQVFNHQTTLSVLINFIGGLYFISLMLKERKA